MEEELTSIEGTLLYIMEQWADVTGITQATKATVDGIIDALVQVTEVLREVVTLTGLLND